MVVNYQQIEDVLLDNNPVTDSLTHTEEERLAAAKQLEGIVTLDALRVINEYRVARGNKEDSHPVCADKQPLLGMMKRAWENNVRRYQTLSPTACVMQVAEEVLGKKPDVDEQVPEYLMRTIHYFSKVVMGNNPYIAMELAKQSGENSSPCTLRDLLKNFESRVGEALNFDL
jgi:hypothetical protein